MSDDVIRSIKPLGFPWEVSDPFLFCAYHNDRYPPGNEQMGPAASLEDRNLGNDFQIKDGFRMYHGTVVPGFPHHPHRGFETVTIVTQGWIDHFDSLGATARYGQGDVQWLTTGRGVEHSEMFPLRNRNEPNPTELFQIWLNLSRENKMAEPHFSMFWHNQVPTQTVADNDGRTTEVTVVAGRLGDALAPAPPPSSWASRPDAHVAIWTVRMEPGAQWKLPAAVAGLNRALFFYRGSSIRIEEASVAPMHSVALASDREVVLYNIGQDMAELLLLQGRPIDEPVAAYGPFVMNTAQEVQQAFADYRRTRFGGWPWPSDGPVHPRDGSRFARYPDGREERPK